MNRRSFLTAIPAAVAALTASRSLAGATSPVAAPEAIVGAPESSIVIQGYCHGRNEYVFPLRAGEKLRIVLNDDHGVFNVYRSLEGER